MTVLPGSENSLRLQLADRRASLEAAITHVGRDDRLISLLREVDAALERLNKGTYGLCETCHDTIEADRLAADPLVRNCLDHLTSDEQRHLEYDLDLAFQVQSALLPRQGFAAGGWRTAYHYEPAGAVSGDFLDIHVNGGNPGSFLFLIGDVTGKGVAASILMSNLHAIFRSLYRAPIPMSSLLEQANRLFCEGTTSRYFATLVTGLALPNGELQICNAGHPPPILLHRGETRTIPATGLPVGMFCRAEYVFSGVTVEPGDTLVLYTDGLTEARNRNEEQFGEERLLSLCSAAHAQEPTELVHTITDSLAAFRSGAQKLDDLTILAVRRDS